MRNQAKRASVWLVFLTAALLYAQPSAAESAVQVHGFGGWGYGHTWNENIYQIGKEDGAYENSNFALNLSASPYEKLSANVQALWKTSGAGLQTQLDYVFAEWAFNWMFKFRVGKVKSPFGIYSEIFDVGVLRPFYMLPQSVYGTPGYATNSYLGLGCTGLYPLPAGWGITYDLYGGKYLLQEYYTDDPLQSGDIVKVEPMVNDMVGARLAVSTPVEGLSFGVSSYQGETEVFMDGVVPGYMEELVSGRRANLLVSAEYLAEAFTARAEYLQNFTIEGEDVLDMNAFYVEVSYMVLEKIQVAGLVDRQVRKMELGLPVEFPEDHMEYAVGVNYWFNPNFVLKLSCHLVEGNLFALPKSYIVNILADTLDDTTMLWVFGTQFSF